jgi:hypothetical protein
MVPNEKLAPVIELAKLPASAAPPWPAYAAPPWNEAWDEEPEEARVALSQYLWILKRYRFRITAFIIAAVISTWIISARLTPIFESTATVDVDRQTPSGVVGDDAAHTALNDADQFLATQIKLIGSDSVLRPVDARFDLRKAEHQSPAFAEGRGEEAPVALKRLTVTRPPNTYLLQISYVPAPSPKGALPEHYFHFDSWRVNVAPGEWVPAEIYVEEEAGKDSPDGTAPRFKAQSRIWDYTTAAANKLDELTSILVDSQSGVSDQAQDRDPSPLESQRSWERQAEDNIVTRLEKGGLLAPAGPVDDVLNTVVNNLIVSAGLKVDAQCRVLMTSPVETFSIGHTIVISRGLIDVLPDEASLALVLAAELSHIALGHPTPTQYAFHNSTMLSDAELLQRFHFERSPEELTEAAKKTIEIMRASPYQKTANAGLFLKALGARVSSLPIFWPRISGTRWRMRMRSTGWPNSQRRRRSWTKIRSNRSQPCRWVRGSN